MVAAVQGARDRQAAGRGRHGRWPTSCPSSASRCRSSRPISRRSIRTSTACWSAARCACSTCSRDERVIDWFCGLGNFTLAAGEPGARGAGHRGQRHAGGARHATTSSAIAPPCPGGARWRATSFVARNLFEMTPAMLVADGAADKWLVDPPREGAFALAKALADLHQQVELHEGGWAPPQAHRLRELQPVDAGARCRAAGASGGLPMHLRGRGQHVPAHLARRIDRGLRPWHEKRAPGALFHAERELPQSRSPPKMPSRASRLWNTLNRSRYSASVALM